MRVVVLGIPLPPGDNRWKDDMCNGGRELGWQVSHIPDKGTNCREVVELCEGADMFIWARTHGHEPSPPSGIERMLRDIEAGGTRTVALHMDLYWGIRGREKSIGRALWWNCQYVFTADGGHQQDFLRRGVNHFWMPPAMGSEYAYQDNVRNCRPDNTHAAIFVGGFVAAIHGRERAELIKWAQARWGGHFALYGRVEGAREQLYGHRLNALYARTGLVLGDSAASPRYWSDRLPCTLGRGALLAHPEVEGMAEHGFTDDVMITFPRGDLEVLEHKINSIRYSELGERREAALALVKEHHLWRHRMQDLANVVMSDGNCYCKRARVRKLGGCWCSR